MGDERGTDALVEARRRWKELADRIAWGAVAKRLQGDDWPRYPSDDYRGCPRSPGCFMDWVESDFTPPEPEELPPGDLIFEEIEETAP